MLNFKFIKYASVLFVLTFVLFSHNVSLAQDQAGETLTRIEIKDVKIEKKEGAVEVSAILKNPSSKIEVPFFNYLLTLEDIEPLISPKSGITPPSLFVSAKEDNSRYSLESSEEKPLSLNLPINSYLPKGNYKLVLRILSDNGEEYGYYEDVIFDLGNNQKQNNNFNEAFLAFDQESCVIMTANGEKYKPNEGPIFNPGESPKISCLVKNIGNKEVAVYPVVEWKEYFVYGRPSAGIKNQKKLEKEIKFLPGETKNVTLSLPGADKPQVYQSLLSFIDANNENRSFKMSFRWTVGGDSARVDKVALASPLKNIYGKGETISLSVDYFGSMDLYWKGVKEGVKDLENLKITATIKDNEGNICGTSELDLPDIKDGYSNNQKIDIALDKKCENISYDVSLLSDDKELAKGSEVLPKVVEENINPYYFYGLGLIFIIIIFLLRKFRKNKNIGGQTMVFLAIFAITFGWFSLAHLAYSETTVTYPDDNGKVIRGETVKGGTVSTYSWGGNWKGGTLWLKASRGSGNERQAWFSVKGYEGIEVNANFSNYFNNDEKIKISTHFKYAFSGCSNEIMYVRSRMIFKTDNGEDYINFRPYGGGKFDKYEDFTVSADTGATSGSRSYEIQKSELDRLYDTAKKLKANPKIILEYTMIMDNTHAGQTASQLVVFGTTGGSTMSETWNLSDVINIEIPLNLPNPSVSLSANPTTVTPPAKDTTLTWNTTDVSNCTASSPVFNDWTGTKSGGSGQTETIKDIWTGIQGLTATETHDFTLTCNRQIGGSTYEYKSSATVTAVAPPLRPLIINRTSTGGSGVVTINFSNKYPLAMLQSPADFVEENKDIGWVSKVASYFGGVAEAGSKKVSIFMDKFAFISSLPPCPLSVSSSSCSTSLPPTYVKLTAVPNDATQYSGGWSSCPVATTSAVCEFLMPPTPVTATAKFTAKSGGTCTDGIMNQDETAIDTGGVCGGPTDNKTLTVEIYGEKWTDGSNIAGGSVTGTNGFSCIGNKTTDSSIAVGADKLLQTCTKDYDENTNVDLYASPASGCPASGCVLKKWDGACSGGNCSFTMDANKTVKAYFKITQGIGHGGGSSSSAVSSVSSNPNPGTFNLTVVQTGTGSGSVSLMHMGSLDGNDGGLDSNISGSSPWGLAKNWIFQITAAPSSGSYLGGVSGGGCSGSPCSITMSGDKTVTVTFNSDVCVGGCGNDPVAYISARENPVLDGATDIDWGSTNTSSCTQSGGGNDSAGWENANDTISGSYYATGFSTSEGSRTYTINCTNGSKTALASIVVDVGGDFGEGSVDIWADESSIKNKETTTIKWSSSNIISSECTLFSATDTMNGYLSYLSSGNFGSGYYKQVIKNNLNGQLTGKLTSDTVYKIRCMAKGPAYVTDQTTVTVAPPVSDFTLTNTTGNMTATIVEGLSANSSSVNLALSGETIGNVSISGSVPSILSGAKAQFSSDDGVTWNDTLSIDISVISQVKVKAINIPGATATGTYNMALTAKDVGVGGITKKLNVPLQVKKVSSEWQEF